MNPPIIRIEHSEFEAVDHHLVIAIRQASDSLHHHAAYRVEFFLFEGTAKNLVKIFNGGERLDRISPILVLLDKIVLIEIEFIFDISNNLLENILNGY